MIDPSLKILFCAFQVIPEPSGTSARLAGFLRALNGKCTVDALTAKSPDVAHIERFHGARLMRVPVGAGDLAARSQAFERAVRRQLESDEYQIIQFSDPFAGTALLDHKSKLRFKAVYDACAFPSFDLRFTDPHLEGDRTFVGKLKRAELLCLMGSDAIFTASTVHRDHIVSLGVPRQKVTVLSPSLDLKPYEKLASARPDRIPMRLLYLGSQAAWQGLPTLLFALKDALKQPAAGGVRLSIVGPNHPDWRGQLDEQVKASGLSGNVDFIDPPSRDDLPRLLAQHDVGVLPLEKSERSLQMPGVIMKVAEYAAAGRAIIASDLPITRTLLDERAAIFFPPSREPALSQAIVTLAKEPLRRVQMGQAARALALERFDDAKASEKILAVYAGFGLHGTPRSGEHEIEAPTSVGGEASPDAPAELPPPPEMDTGRVHTPFAETGRITVPFEPTPIGAPGASGRSVTDPHVIPAGEPPPSEPTPAELRAAPPAAGRDAREDLFGPPVAFDELVRAANPDSPTSVAELAPVEAPAPEVPLPDLPLMGELVSESHDPPPTLAGELVESALPPEIFGLPPEPAPAPKNLPRTGPPVLAPSGPPVLAPGRPPTSAGLNRPRPPSNSIPMLTPSKPGATNRPSSPAIPVLAPSAPAGKPTPPPAVASPPPVAPIPPPVAPIPPPVVPTPPPAVASPPPLAPIPAPMVAIPPPLAPIPPPKSSIAAPAVAAPPTIPISTSPVAGPPAGPPPAPAPAPTPAPGLAMKPASPSGEVMELAEDEFSSLDEPEMVEADAVEAVAPPPKPVLQNSLDLGGPDSWFHSLVHGFAPLGQLGAAPIRGSPLSNTAPAKI